MWASAHLKKIYNRDGEKLLVMVSAKLLTHAVCFVDGNVNSYDPPEAQLETVCEVNILPSFWSFKDSPPAPACCNYREKVAACGQVYESSSKSKPGLLRPIFVTAEL